MTTFEDLLNEHDNPKKFYSCKSKEAYDTHDEARMAAYHFELTLGTEQRAYNCEHCDRFHLTTKRV